MLYKNDRKYDFMTRCQPNPYEFNEKFIGMKFVEDASFEVEKLKI